MLNTTLLSLSAISMMYSSPFFIFNQFSQGKFSLFMSNSRFSHSFTNILASYTSKHKTIIQNTFFSHIQNSAIYFANEDKENCVVRQDGKNIYKNGEVIADMTITADQYNDLDNYRPYFNTDSDCGNITITNCIFDGCNAPTFHGGSIHIEQNSFVLIHGTIFNNSFTGRELGGAGLICQKFNSIPPNFNNLKMPQLDIQYCCFQDCYGSNADKYKLYGVALFIAADNVTLYFASTVDCPGIGKEGRDKANGAQFDIQAETVTSKYVNATGGYSKFCGGIEYRQAEDGFFRFQTITNMECMFAIAYTDIAEGKLDLSESNIANIKLVRDISATGNLYSGLIHVRNTFTINSYVFTISNFCFVNNDFSDTNSKIVSRGTNGDNCQVIQVILNGCSYDCTNDNVILNVIPNENNHQTNDCKEKSSETKELSQLFLGNCQGEVTPEPLTPIPFTSEFSPSEDFSKTSDFSKSSFFSKTSVFSETNQFSKTSDFSLTKQFSESNFFTDSPPSEIIPIVVVPETPNSGDGSNKGGKNKTGMIAGIAVAAAAVVIGAVVAAIFIIKKRNHISANADAEAVDDDLETISSVNPIYDNKGEDDPFKEDFNN